MRLTLRIAQAGLLARLQRGPGQRLVGDVQRLGQAVVRPSCSAARHRRPAGACAGSGSGRGRWPSSGRPPRRRRGSRPVDRLVERAEAGSASSSRTSSAMYSKKFTTYSACRYRSRNAGFCVDTHQAVSRWQTRIMMQPDTTSGADAKPYSSAERRGDTTSRPVLSWPSVWTTIRSRRPLSSSVCWVSARPSSRVPACLSDVRRGTRAAVVPGDQHVRVRLRHTRRDRADADLGDQLHVDAGARVGVLEVVDQLRQVLDRVDVVVRRRADQPTPGVECRVLATHG